MAKQTDHDEPTDQVLSLPALLTRARDQEGVDQLWSLTVASLALRERQATPALLDWVDGQLRTAIDSYAHGRPAATPPALIDTLADLAAEGR